MLPELRVERALLYVLLTQFLSIYRFTCLQSTQFPSFFLVS